MVRFHNIANIKKIIVDVSIVVFTYNLNERNKDKKRLEDERLLYLRQKACMQA